MLRMLRLVSISFVLVSCDTVQGPADPVQEHHRLPGIMSDGGIAPLSTDLPVILGMSTAIPSYGNQATQGPVALGMPTSVPWSAAIATSSPSGPHLLWQNLESGMRSVWHLNGTEWDGAYTMLPNVAPDWRIVGAGEFNGDGQTDLVWYNAATGQSSIWFLSGWPAPHWDTGAFRLLPTVPTAWQIATTGDFNSDGMPDLVWQNIADGMRSIWFLQENGGYTYAVLPQVSVQWRIAAAGDFNRDGSTDLVWQNTSTGMRSIWFMNGSGWNGAFALLPQVPPEWDIAAAVDVDGDTHVDLVWQNTSNGLRSIWLMDAAAWEGRFELLPQVATSWRIAAAVPPIVAEPPLAPTQLTSTAESTSQINLTWLDNSTNETGFRIERCAGAACTGFVQIASVAANIAAYQDNGLTGGLPYTYRVRAFTADNTSNWSNIATAVTVLPAPSSLTATAVSSSQINLGWLDNSTTELGFRIERCAGASCTNFVEIATVGANTAAYQSTGLVAGTTYRFRVRAYTAYSSVTYYSQYSAPVTTATLAAPTTGTVSITTVTTGGSPDPDGYTLSTPWAIGIPIGVNATRTFTGVAPGTHSIALGGLAPNCTTTSNPRTITVTAGATTSTTFNVSCPTPPPLQIRIINNGSTTQRLHDVVRLKLELNEASYGNDDLLTDDNLASCVALPGPSIEPGESQAFPQTVGSSYAVFVQMGIWETDFVTGLCPTSAPWFRNLQFQTTDGRFHNAYASVLISGHTSGTVDFTITGSYTSGNLTLTLSQGGVVFYTTPFTITTF